MKPILQYRFHKKHFTVRQQLRMPIYEEELWCNKNKVIYGPVASRRLKESLGINFFPKAKICSFNCCYCDVNITSPNAFDTEFQRKNIIPPELLKVQIEEGIKSIFNQGIHVDYVTICGNGEATDYPFFVDIAEYLLDLRAKLFPKIPLAILTNSANIGKTEIRATLEKYDKVFYKLDAGDERTFNNINRPVLKNIRYEEIVRLLSTIKQVIIQTAIVDSPECSNIRSLKGPYIDVVKDINPCEIYIHNIDYPVPYKYIRRLSLNEMKKLGEYIAERTNIPVIALHSRKSLREKNL
ncbi:MAG: radical SAM protein [candidate division WOR-3 bacterium]